MATPNELREVGRRPYAAFNAYGEAALPGPAAARNVAAKLTDGLPALPVAVVGLSMLVRSIDNSLFSLLSPEIKATFHLGLTGITALSAVVLPMSFLLDPVVSYLADRWRRTTMLAVASVLFAAFTFLTGVAGLAVGLGLMYVARLGAASVGVFNSTQLSLLSDFYPPATRAKLFYVRPVTDIGAHLIGPLFAGLVAAGLGWQAPFMLMAVPTVIAGLVLARLPEPPRGFFERRASGQPPAQVAAVEPPLRFGRAILAVLSRPATRRFYLALPFLVTVAIGTTSFAQLFYSQVFQVGVAARGIITAIAEPCQLAGILVGSTVLRRVLARNPVRALRLTAAAVVGIAAALLVFVSAPVLPVAIAAQAMMTALTALVVPGIYVLISLLVPPRMRTTGFGVSSLFLLLGAVTIPLVGVLGDRFGIRTGLAVLVPLTAIGALVLASAGRPLARDLAATPSRSDTDALRETPRAAGLGGEGSG